MNNRFAVFAATIATLVIVGSGCLATQNPEPVAGHVTIERADPEAGILIGSYEWDGTRLRFEGLRGAENPGMIRMLDPQAPSHAVEARVCDERGWCFLIAAGGHGLTDAAWAVSATDTPPDSATTGKNIEAAWHMAADLETMTDQLRGLTDIRDALVGLGRANPPDTWRPLNTETQTRTTPQEGVVSSALSSSTSYTHQFEIWWKPLIGVEHSSTRTRVLDAYARPTLTYETYNHGSAPGSYGSGRLCTRQFSSRPAWIPISSNCGATASFGVACSGNGCCGTPYGLASGEHVCNDDSRLQRDMIVANSVFCVSYCGDFWPAPYAPGCW